MAAARAGIFLSSMTASPPSTFFSCAFRAAVVANTAVAERNARRVSSAAPVEVLYFEPDSGQIFSQHPLYDGGCR